MHPHQINVDNILKLTHRLLRIEDLDVLLETILSEAMDVAGADAGSVYLVEGNQLKFSYTSNLSLQKKLPPGKKLIYSTFSIAINNKSIAGYVANTGISVDIPDAYHIDTSQPYSFDKSFDEATGYHTQSMLAVPIKNIMGKVLGVIQLINSIGLGKLIRSFTPAEETIVQFFADSAAIAIEHAQMIRSMIQRTNKMIELHDPTETVQHINRVAAYSVEIYETWAHKHGIPENNIKHDCEILRMAAMSHDIGKIAVPVSILKNKNHLTPEEQKLLQYHTVYGASLFSNVTSAYEKMARDIALNHHERWDGLGYPGHVNLETGLPLPGYEKPEGTAFGKKREEIPLFARIVAVANTYDILMYSLAHEEKDPAKRSDVSVQKILAESGKQFDPEVVESFLSCLDVIKSISTRYPDPPTATST